MRTCRRPWRTRCRRQRRLPAARGSRRPSLAVYAGEYSRNGFQGGLNWYRATRDPECVAQLQLFHGKNNRRAGGVHRRIVGLGRATSRRARWDRMPVGLHEVAGHGTSSTAPDTGSSRNSPRRWRSCCSDFLDAAAVAALSVRDEGRRLRPIAVTLLIGSLALTTSTVPRMVSAKSWSRLVRSMPE